MNNVTEFPQADRPQLLRGPFEEYRVVVRGRCVPNLTGWKEGDRTWLCVDRRFGAVFSTDDDAHSAASLIAEAMAIGAGYSNFEAESKDRPFAPKIIMMDTP